MRKQICFAAALAAFLATVVFAASNVVGDPMRSKLGFASVVAAPSFIPTRTLEPAW